MIQIADKKIRKLGFTKIDENRYNVEYERKNKEYGYTQVVCIICKATGNHIIQSYDKDLFDSKHIGNTCVGLTLKEIRAFSRKMKECTHSWRKDGEDT